MKKSLLFILGLVLFIFTSCEYKIIEPIIVELPDEPVIFSEQVEPFLFDKCGSSCHSSQSPILTIGNTYDNLIDGGYIDTDNPPASEVYIKVNSGHHSSNPLSPEEMAYLLKWIEEGAIDN